jgi:PleD family two-component response regulator
MLHGGEELPVTLSGGIAELPADGTDWDKVFAVADARLYEAKRSGRNRVVGGAGAGYAALSRRAAR